MRGHEEQYGHPCTDSKHSNDPSGSSDKCVSLSPYKVTAALTAGLLLLAFTPRVQSNATLAYSVIGAAQALGAWQIFQILTARWSDQTFGFKLVVRRQHYIQMMVQFSVYLYWGYYWRPVYDHLWLLAAQVLFAFSFDMLLSWSRKRDYTLGFGPIPIIFSTNLFMWFRDDWFYLQF